MKNLNLQQLAAIIDDEDKFIEEFIDKKLYEKFNFNSVVGTSIKLLNTSIIQKYHKNVILQHYGKGLLPESFKISEELDPREEVDGGWKWNGDLTVDNLKWDKSIFNGKPVIEVTGDFYCDSSDLKSLKGSPRKIGESFDCSFNELETLEGGPEEVGINFIAYDNNLKSLKGSPKIVGADFNVHGNDLRNLDGAPDEVGGYFNAYENKNLDQSVIPKTNIGLGYEND